MSRLNDLLRQVANTDPQLAKDLQRETDALADRRAFGLNFERHVPEAVELPGRPVRKNDKVRILPERGQMPKKENERLYRVEKTYNDGGERWADVVAVDDPEEAWSVVVGDLVVVAEFRDPIYPGLVSTGKVERGGDKPFHTVINAENYHALQTLLFTHRGRVDVIYIDPPYNTGARDWKYNNNYVDSDDHYRHSKWLAMMERRLVLARELLNPSDSVLIVTIDEKEYLRLGLLLEQIFSEARIQMISSVINPAASTRTSEFGRTDEYIFFVMFGNAAPRKLPLREEWLSTNRASKKAQTYWEGFARRGANAARADRPGGFYPIFVSRVDGVARFDSIGDVLPLPKSPTSIVAPRGCVSIWPIRKDGSEGRWRMSPETARIALEGGFLRLGPWREASTTVYYIPEGPRKRMLSGEIEVVGRSPDGSVLTSGEVEDDGFIPGTQWRIAAHNASVYGSTLLRSFLPGRKFPFPKSVYAVEDTIRFFSSEKKNAVVLDFFSGSGTTAHAVMRLNKQDGGQRQCISVTNNEVSAEDQVALRKRGLRPVDEEWISHGICSFITAPRITAAILGETPDRLPIKGEYKFIDEFPLAEGFKENAEFFTLTYESAMRVSSNREFSKIAPFLWLRSGSRGRRIDDISDGWDVSEAYGVIANLDLSEPFIKRVEAQDGLNHVFIITDEDRLFEAMVRKLPDDVEPVRLYSSYLRNFEIEAGRAAR